MRFFFVGSDSVTYFVRATHTDARGINERNRKHNAHIPKWISLWVDGCLDRQVPTDQKKNGKETGSAVQDGRLSLVPEFLYFFSPSQLAS